MLGKSNQRVRDCAAGCDTEKRRGEKGNSAFWHGTWHLLFVMIWAGNCPWCWVFSRWQLSSRNIQRIQLGNREGKKLVACLFSPMLFYCSVRCKSMGIVPVTELNLFALSNFWIFTDLLMLLFYPHAAAAADLSVIGLM